MKKAVKLTISGNVQGVFFRAYIKQEADKLNIKGYVRNIENGNVETGFEGNNEDVEKMIEVCRKGAPHSVVREVVIEERKFEGLKDFRILHI